MSANKAVYDSIVKSLVLLKLSPADQKVVLEKIEIAEKEPVFNISVNPGGMWFTLLRPVQGVQFVAWREGERQETVTVGEPCHTMNTGNEGVIIDGGTQANSFYVTATCFSFSVTMGDGVHGHLTHDNLLAGDIVAHFSVASRNDHPDGSRLDMFPNDA